MTEDMIGVIISLYNGDNHGWVLQALKSILEQSYKNFTIYLGIDGPINDSLKACITQYANEKRIKIYNFVENRGLAAVLNDLLQLCMSDGVSYIARMDADDISLPLRFERQVEYLIKHPEVDVVGCSFEEINEESKKNGKTVNYPTTNKECRLFYRYRDPLPHVTSMFKTSFFQKVHGYRAEYRQNQDTMLWFDAFCNGCVLANIPEVLMHVRVSSDFYKKRRNGIKRAKKMLKDRFMINKTLQYDITANLYAIGYFFMTISPPMIKKILYRLR
jgi:glycosyltransferase involved in cell wall biosynthesis